MSAHDRRMAKLKGRANEPVSESPEEKSKRQHAVHLENAGIVIQHALNTVSQSGVDKALFVILKTVRHWPSSNEETDSLGADLPFKATGVSAEEISKDDAVTTRVSFSYSGETYEFVSRIENASFEGRSLGTISLHENDERTINIAIVYNRSDDQFTNRDLNAFKYGTWIENILAIEKEIEQYHEDLAEGIDKT